MAGNKEQINPRIAPPSVMSGPFEFEPYISPTTERLVALALAKVAYRQGIEGLTTKEGSIGN